MVVNKNHPLIVNSLFPLFDPASMAWEPFRAGIEIHRLYDCEGGPSAALLRYAADAKLTRHVHVGYEHILILAGSQIDDSGEHHTGALLIHGPGSSHAISSPRGCIVLAVWERPVRFLSDAEGVGGGR